MNPPRLPGRPRLPRDEAEARMRRRISAHLDKLRASGRRVDLYLTPRARGDLDLICATWGIDSNTAAINTAIKYLAHATRAGLRRLTVPDG